MSSNLVRMEYKTHVLQYLIVIIASTFYLNSIYTITSNNISINSQFGWIYTWVLELIECDCTYSQICNKLSPTNTFCGAQLEAMEDAAIKAGNHHFQQVLFLNYSRRLAQILDKNLLIDWQMKTMVEDLNHLKQNGLNWKLILVPRLVINSVRIVANMATMMPMHQCWSNPAFL